MASLRCPFFLTRMTGISSQQVDDVDGEGPEHMTLADYPDGYYVFAVNNFSLDQEDHAYVNFTLRIGAEQYVIDHAFFLDESAAETPNWVRCYDVRVENGSATVLSPGRNVYVRYQNLAKMLVR